MEIYCYLLFCDIYCLLWLLKEFVGNYESIVVLESGIKTYTSY